MDKELLISSYKDASLFILLDIENNERTILTNVLIYHNILLIKKAYT